MKSKKRQTLIPVHLALIAMTSWISGSHAALQEHEIKAAYIFNFAKFIDWPPQSFSNPTSPLIIGIIGGDPLGAFLDREFSGQSVRGRPLVTKRLGNQSCSDCHIIFVSSSEAGRLEEILRTNRNKHVVTISDIPQFDAKGGMIRLFVEENKVRFTINTQAAEAAGVKISSQLLKLSHDLGGS